MDPKDSRGLDSSLAGKMCQLVSVCQICLTEAWREAPEKEVLYAMCASGGHLQKHLLLMLHNRHDGDEMRAGPGTGLLFYGANFHCRCHRLPGPSGICGLTVQWSSAVLLGRRAALSLMPQHEAHDVCKHLWQWRWAAVPGRQGRLGSVGWGALSPGQHESHARPWGLTWTPLETHNICTLRSCP